MKRLAAAALLLAGMLQASAMVEFSAEERARIASFGPWPMSPALDAGNPVAGKPAAIALGEKLFFDKRLSADGRLACVSCHAPALAFTDGQPRSIGRERLDRNAPSLWNAAHQRWYGWDGASDSLWSQALRVMQDGREFATDAQALQRLVRSDAELACRWREVFGDGRPREPERTMVQMAQAIGAYVGSLQSPRTAFDEFRDAVVNGDAAEAARYPLEAQRGLQLFIGRGRCHLCHLGPLFTNGEFADVGIPFFVRPGVVDSGRHGGLLALQAGRYNLLGPWARPRGDEAVKTRHVRAEHRHFGEFKVPSLRHVAATAPYMHDGSLATLADVIRHYDRIDLERLHADGERILTPLYLSEQERAELEAFLRSLGNAPSPPLTHRAGDRRSACGSRR